MTTATLMRSLRFHSSFGKYIRRKRCSITNRLSHLATSSSSNYTSKKLIDDKEWKQKLQKGPSFHDFLTMSQKKEENVATSIEEIKQMLSEIDMQESHGHLLVDRYGRQHTYLRISLTERCNLRCLYCMPEDGVPLQQESALLSTQEILNLAKLFANAGINRIRLTGGEPLLRKDLVDLVKELRAIKGIESVGVTTNGLLLQKKLQSLYEAGVDRLNISLDTLQPNKFAQITRRQGFERVLESIIQASQMNFGHRIKINCVVMRHFNLEEILDFIEFTKDHKVDVRFIEWMPFDSNKWNDQTFVSFQEMVQLIETKYPIINKLQDDPNDTSKAFQIPTFKGQFGFITSMSQHFCGSCNRLRLTADGNLKVCLFGNREVSLREALRDGGITNKQIIKIIDAAVKRKKFALGGHQDMYGISKAKNRPMILIGG